MAVGPHAQVVEDPAAASAVRRVVCISIFIFFLNIIAYAVPFAFTRNAFSLLMMIGFALCIPGCGYGGAKYRSKSLVGCFWCCNLCNLILLVTWFIIVRNYYYPCTRSRRATT